nr:hypothetical protein [Tanacetum cinerariifolium]
IKDEESFDPILKTPENTNDEGNGEENLRTNVGRDEGQDEKDEADELYRDVNINLGRGIQLGDLHMTQEVEDSHVTLTLFAGAVSSILRIVQRCMDQRMNEAVKVAVQIQSDRLRDEAQAEFSRLLMKTCKRSSRSSSDSVIQLIEDLLCCCADLLEMELKKILIEKMEGNKSIHRSNEKRNLYKALVEAYESDKIILDTYEDTVTQGKEPESASAPQEKATRSAGKSTQGSKSRQMLANESAIAEEPMQTTFEMEEPSHPEFETGDDDQPIVEPSQHPEWFSQQKKPPTPDRDWNKTLSATHRSIQPWISDLAKLYDSRSSFNELMDTLVDFSTFLMNRLKVNTLTPELLAGPNYELMKGSCKSLVELEFLLEEVYKAMTCQLDWVNPKGHQYPHNLLKPLPLIPNNRGRRVIPFDHFINNNLEYLCGGASSRKYTTSVTKTKATDYRHIKWIEDLVPSTLWIQEPIGYESRRVIPFDHFINNNLEYLRGGASSRKYTAFVTKTKAADYRHIKWIEDLVPSTLWIQEPIGYDKHALWGISHWGRKRQQFYGFAVNRESARDVYSKRRIIVVTELKIVEWHNYKYLDWIMLTNLTVEELFAFNISLRMFTRSIIIQRRVEDLQLGVESYQKKLNLTKPDMYRSDLKRKEAYIAYSNPRGFIYQNKDKQNRLMRIDELRKFSDGTLTDVRTALDDRLKGIRMKYLPHSIWRKS